MDLLYAASSADGADWTGPRLLTEGKVSSLLSPAVVGDKLFCVECEGEDSRLVWYGGPSGLGERTACGVEGLEQDFLVWHIDCATLPNGTVRGLFLLSKKSAPSFQGKLALFLWEPEKNLWRWERDLPQTEEEKKRILFAYKSCFTDRPDRVLCSACDWKRRFFLYEKSI